MQKMVWFACGLLIGLTALSITKAAIPKGGVANDTVMGQELTEINVPKHLKLNFDSEIQQLAEKESDARYREKLPSLDKHPRLQNVLKRVSKEKYRPSYK